MILDGNIFIPVTGWEEIYKVNYLGVVISSDRYVRSGRSTSGFMLIKGKIKSHCNVNGYRIYQFNRFGKGITISQHRLIAIHFIPNPENKPFVNHLNGIRNDNRIENLEWVTPLENVLHARETGLFEYIGAKNIKTKLTEEQVREIREIGHSVHYEKTGRKYGVTGVTIRNVLTGVNWKHLK